MATTTPLAYNTGSTIPGTTQIGDLAVGTTDQDYSTNPGGVTWWMGPDEDLGYVIGVPVPGNTQPTQISGVFASVGFFRSDDLTDGSFINIAEYVANEYNTPQTFSSATDASNWLTTNGFWNSYTSALLLSLDSGNPSSYSGTGSTWFDISGYGNNATLVNSPIYSSSYDGILQFDDASLEYGTFNDLGNLSEFTVEVWFRLTSSLTGKVSSIVSNQYNLSSALNFSIGTNNAPFDSNLSVGFYDNSWYTTTGFVPQTNVWYQVVGTYDGTTLRQYINGQASGGTINISTNPISGGNNRLMRRWDESLSPGNLIDGDLAIVKIYNQALSSSDILNSYNSTYTRFLDVTPTPTPTNTVTPTPTATNTPTPSPTNTPTPTPTPTSGGSGNFNVTVSQVGPNVVWSGSGSFNLTSLTLKENIPGVTGGYNKSFAQFVVGPTSPSGATTYSGSSFTTFPTNFGSGSGFPPSSSSGSLFGIVQTSGPSGPREVLVPSGYVSGTVISGSMTYNSQTIAGMGLTTGTYTWSWGTGGNVSTLVMTISS
jgi:hypothetical protein